MPPQRRVDLDLDALAPPNRTIRLRGQVYELPGDIPIDTIIRAMQLQDSISASDTDEETREGIDRLLEIIYDLFRECDPNFVPVKLSLNQVLNILGLVLSGANIDFERAIQEAILGEDGGETKSEEGAHPPTPPLRAVKPAAAKASASRSRRRSPARS